MTTKAKILNVASELFAQKGFAATSIREISSLAKVNISAIHYHFQDKAGLYWEVFYRGRNWFENEIEKIGENEELTVGETALEIYNFFLENHSLTLNMFRMLFSEKVNFEKKDLPSSIHELGPPGRKLLMKKIKKEFGEGFSEDDLRWASGMIFTIVVQYGVFARLPMFLEKSKLDPFLQEDSMREGISRAVKGILLELTSSNQD